MCRYDSICDITSILNLSQPYMLILCKYGGRLASGGTRWGLGAVLLHIHEVGVLNEGKGVPVFQSPFCCGDYETYFCGKM